MTGAKNGTGPWWIVTLLTLCFTINFIDRLVLSTVAPTMLKQLHFSTAVYSDIVFAFMLGVTLGQIPVGAFIDRIGVRWGLADLVAGWSLANMAQALASAARTFSGLRFFMGLFECGTYSAGVKSIGEIFPAERCAFPLGVFNSGTLLGSVIAPPLVVCIAKKFGWRAAFLLPGLAGGLFWIPLWLRAYRPRPPAQPSHRLGSATPQLTLGNLLSLRQTWGVIVMRTLSGPLSQFYWYFLPLYLVRGRGLSMGAMAGLASMSYAAGGCGQLGAGYFSGLLIGHGWGTDRTRKLTYTFGTAVAVGCTFIAPLITSSFEAVALIALANFGINIVANHNMAVVTDVFPAAVLARVTGMTGMGEGIADMVMMLLAGIVIDRFSWFAVFAAMALMPLGALAGLLVLVRSCTSLKLQDRLAAT